MPCATGGTSIQILRSARILVRINPSRGRTDGQRGPRAQRESSHMRGGEAVDGWGPRRAIHMRMLIMVRQATQRSRSGSRLKPDEHPLEPPTLAA